MNDRQFLNEISKKSLLVYARQAFKVIEPSNTMHTNWHIECICEHLEASFRGELPKLIINIAPRFLKSVLVAQIFPSWAMGLDPSHQFIGASYAHSLAERNVVKARQIMQSEFYKELFPDTNISKDQNQKDFFTTTKAGQYKGTGIGGTITGFGCKTLLIDDGLSPKEGMSATIREKTNDEIRSTLFSRYNDSRDARFIMIMQRIHEDDPTGNLMKDLGYYLLKLPAENTTSSPIIIDLGQKRWTMAAGDLLDPVRSPKEVLEQKRKDLLDYHYVGQYLQEPVPLGGGAFRQEWIQYYRAGSLKPREMNVCILVDPSGGEEVNRKKKKMSDWTAMHVIGLGKDNNYYWLDSIRDRLNPTERVDTLFMLHRKWNELCNKPPKVGYEKVSMQSDTHYIKNKMSDDSYHFQLVELYSNVAKEDRIMQLVPDMQMGRWYFPDNLFYVDGEGRKFDLVQELIKGEMSSFPRARFDDMLDCMSFVYNPNLNLSFPKKSATMVQKAISDSLNQQYDSWYDA